MKCRSFLVAALMLVFAPSLLAAPKVVVSIPPVYSLVAGVMEGIGEPTLLIQGGGSPHNFTLKPSQRRELGHADLIVWVGESVEGFLPRVLATAGKEEQSMELMALQGMRLLKARSAGQWSEGHSHDHGHSHGHDHHVQMDGHMWLNPQNAKRIITAVTERLVVLDAQNASDYRNNAERVQEKLDLLDKRLKAQLGKIKEKPYLVFHDAYQYLEAHYGLKGVGAISVDPERKPGAKRLKQIRKAIRQQNVQCVFSEPQFSSNTIRVVAEGSDVKTAVLDPMGAEHGLGVELYFNLMRELGNNLAGCLQE